MSGEQYGVAAQCTFADAQCALWQLYNFVEHSGISPAHQGSQLAQHRTVPHTQVNLQPKLVPLRVCDMACTLRFRDSASMNAQRDGSSGRGRQVLLRRLQGAAGRPEADEDQGAATRAVPAPEALQVY